MFHVFVLPIIALHSFASFPVPFSFLCWLVQIPALSLVLSGTLEWKWSFYSSLPFYPTLDRIDSISKYL
ncbi:hypothetical protein VNO77_17849 [Canavalia gladiata]|uniref:Uncharacterized protein n=1 Tax=Canavalia gladiata TaxID=3824 RepID=A0AAN9LN45_CANGL